MIITTYTQEENKYGRFFLATEAKPHVSHVHKNTKVLNISPNRGRRIDFNKAAGGDEDYEEDDTTPAEDEDMDDTDFSNMSLEDDDEEDVGDDETALDTDDTDFGDIDVDDEENTTDDMGDGTDGPDTGDNTDFNTDDGGETQGDAPDTGDADSGGSGDSPDTGDGTDFTDTNGDQGGDGSDPNGDNPDTNDDPNTDNEDGEKGPGLEYASTRKYALFLNYEILLNALTNYINKLENNIGDDINTNKILKAACTKLREIKDLCYEYMLMKFELDTYVKALLFYQNAVIMIQSVFTLLKRIKVHKNKLIDMKNGKKPVANKRTLK